MIALALPWLSLAALLLIHDTTQAHHTRHAASCSTAALHHCTTAVFCMQIFNPILFRGSLEAVAAGGGGGWRWVEMWIIRNWIRGRGWSMTSFYGSSWEIVTINWWCKHLFSVQKTKVKQFKNLNVLYYILNYICLSGLNSNGVDKPNDQKNLGKIRLS